MKLTEAEKTRWDKIGTILGFTGVDILAVVLMYASREGKNAGQIIAEGGAFATIVMTAALSRIKKNN